MIARPLPDLRNAGARFWRAAATGTLLLPRCIGCERVFWHPRPRCPYCGSDRVEWTPSGGKGVIHTYTIVRQAADPYFRARLPYAVAMIDLDDGVRLMSNIVETPLDALHIGLRVEVVFEAAGEDLAIPLFRADRSAQAIR
jgi:uncharacterized protein